MPTPRSAVSVAVLPPVADILYWHLRRTPTAECQTQIHNGVETKNAIHTYIYIQYVIVNIFKWTQPSFASTLNMKQAIKLNLLLHKCKIEFKIKMIHFLDDDICDK